MQQPGVHFPVDDYGKLLREYPMYTLTRRSFMFGTALVLAALMFASSAAASITAAARTGNSANCVPSAAGLALTDGAQAYCDRLDPEYFWTGFPGDLTDVLDRTEYLIVANEDRDVADYGLDVTVDFEGTLLLFIDQRVDVDANMPWVATDGYSDSGLSLTLNTMPAFPNQLFDIWTLDVEPGAILLGPIATGPQNEAGAGNYGVAFVTDQVDIEIVAENLGSKPVTAGVTDDWWVKFTVTNLGPDDASGVVFDGAFVASNLLTGTVCSVQTEDGTLTPTGPGTSTWDIGDLVVDQTAVLERKCTIGAGVPAGTKIDWDFTLNSVDQQETNTENNTDGIDSTIQRVATWDVTKIWDGGEVGVDILCSNGYSASATSGGTDTFTVTGFDDGVTCDVTEIVPDGYAPTYSPDCNVDPVTSGQTYVCDITNATTVARFQVTKDFTDGSTDEVEVTLTCNTGLPLEQSLTIAGGDPTGVTFVVRDYIDGTMSCSVTEATNTPGYDADATGCVWDNVMTSDSPFSCVINNTAQDATFTAWMEWNNYEGGDAVDADEEVQVTITCNSLITSSNGSTGSCGIGCWKAWKDLGDDDALTVTASTLLGSTSCSASQGDLPSGVESSDDCGIHIIPAGGIDSCKFTNTVFFEGIPTLSQYGLALMALLMLGMGMVGFRRFA
jgi:hypothetical protein